MAYKNETHENCEFIGCKLINCVLDDCSFIKEIPLEEIINTKDGKFTAYLVKPRNKEFSCSAIILLRDDEIECISWLDYPLDTEQQELLLRLCYDWDTFLQKVLTQYKDTSMTHKDLIEADLYIIGIAKGPLSLKESHKLLSRIVTEWAEK